VDGAGIARILLSIPSTTKVVVEFVYPDMVKVQFICPPDRALKAVEDFLANYYRGHAISIPASEPAQAKAYEVNFKEWFEKTLADLRGRKKS
jgi:hypothetical protein